MAKTTVLSIRVTEKQKEGISRLLSLERKSLSEMVLSLMTDYASDVHMQFGQHFESMNKELFEIRQRIDRCKASIEKAATEEVRAEVLLLITSYEDTIRYLERDEEKSRIKEKEFRRIIADLMNGDDETEDEADGQEGEE